MTNPFPFSSGDVLTAANLNATADVPRVSVRNSSDQAMTGAGYNIVTFTDEVFDTHGMHDNSTNPSRLTIPAGWGGYYLLVASGVVSTGTLSIVFYKNGSLLTYADYCNNHGCGTAIVQATAGDYFEWRGYASTNLNLYGYSSLGGNTPQFAATWVASA